MEDTIHRVCSKGDTEGLVNMLKKKGKKLILSQDEEYLQTPLHICCEKGNDEMVSIILNEKYKTKHLLNSTDKNGWTPLHSACKSSSLNVIDTLINKGAKCSLLTNEGASPLHYLIRNEYADTLKFQDIVRHFIKNLPVNTSNKFGETPLHQAAMRGKSKNVLTLLYNGADPNILTNNGESALYFAIRGNHKSAVNILLQNKADPTMLNPKLGSLYAVAKEFECEEIQQILIQWYVNNKIPLISEMQADLDRFPPITASNCENAVRKPIVTMVSR